MRILKIMRNNKFLGLLVCWTLFFIGFAYLLPIGFEENDDVIMLLFASGKYSGTPDAHLIFINYVYGLLLTALYSNIGDIEWYTVIFAIIHIIALSVISWIILKKEKIQSAYKLLFIGLLAILEVKFILYFQFTSTAALGSLAGILLIQCQKTFQRIFGVLLFVVAGLIRFEAAVLVLAILVPVLLNVFCINRKIIFYKPMLYLTAGLVLLFFCKYVDYRSYQGSEKWKYFYQYNKARGTINDNPNAWEIAKTLPAGTSISDYSLLLAFFPDNKAIELKKITSINQQLKEISFQRKLKNVLPAFRVFTYYLILLIVACGIIFFSANQKRNNLILIITLLVFFAALFYISLDGSVKYRVFLAALLPLLYVMYSCIEANKKGLAHTLLVMSISSFILLLCKQHYGLWTLRKYAREELYTQQMYLVKEYLKNEENSIVPFVNDLTVQLIPPFTLTKKFPDRLYFSCWAANIPHNINKLESYLDLVDRHAIFFEKGNIETMLPLIKKSIRDNYGIAVVSKVELESKNFVILKLITNNKLP